MGKRNETGEGEGGESGTNGMLRPALLTLHTNPSLGVRQPHRTLRLVDVLPSSAGRAKKLHADVFGVDVAQITLVGVFVYRQDLVQKRGS
jgi:hypothetical protein